jgi:hypothetical protein
VSVTGIHETAGGEVMIYPNPAFRWIYVKLQSARSTEQISYSIMNASGLRVATGRLDASAAVQGQYMDITRFSSGIYFLQLEGVGWVDRRRFVIDREGR